MKLWDVVKSVGSSVIREVVPGGGILVDAVNEFLPDDQKLPNNATGKDVDKALASLPADQRARIMEKEFDVDITQIRQSNETVRAMLAADATTKHTTRPYIAKHAFHVVAFAVILTVAAWAYGVIASDDMMVQAITNGWPFILSVIGPFVVLLRAYFGVLRDEDRNRMSAASGNSSPAGLAGALSGLLKRGR